MKRVKWEIDIDARTAKEAARQALRIQRDLESTATVFEVRDRRKKFIVDLSGVERVRFCRIGPKRPAGGGSR